jgi:transposase-like protein
MYSMGFFDAGRLKTIKNRGRFPSDEAESQLIRLGLRRVQQKWNRSACPWVAAMNLMNPLALL